MIFRLMGNNRTLLGGLRLTVRAAVLPNKQPPASLDQMGSPCPGDVISPVAFRQVSPGPEVRPTTLVPYAT